jgi:hypothetical protein
MPSMPSMIDKLVSVLKIADSADDAQQHRCRAWANAIDRVTAAGDGPLFPDRGAKVLEHPELRQ